MIRTHLAACSVLMALLACAGAHARADKPPHNRMYLDQSPPDMVPQLFAPDVVSTGLMEHSSPTFSPEGDEAYWAASTGRSSGMTIYFVRFEHGAWRGPHVAPFSGDCVDGCPSLSPNGQKLFFASSRLDPECETSGNPTELDIWLVEREGKSWGRPLRLGDNINSAGREYCPVAAGDGTLYFDGDDGGPAASHGLYYSSYADSGYRPREKFPSEIQSEYADFSPCVAPDGSYLVFASFRPGGYGKTDLYVTFRDPEDKWSSPVNLGPGVNTENNERFPGVSRDGEFLFFVSDRPIANAGPERPGNGLGDVYWVDADVFRVLRVEARDPTVTAPK